jgi:enterochelin esterase-like enzyme
MRRVGGRSAARGLLATAVAALGAVALASSPRAAPEVVDGAFYSHVLRGTVHYAVALPPGYATSGERYPVVYFLHGLPAGPDAYRSVESLAASLARSGRHAIVVGAQGARIGDTDPEWHDWGPGRDWETATAVELVHWIDAHYRTIARRSGRAIVGVSGGGYGAALIGIHHPGTYQVIESWSGYFVPTDPNGNPLDLGTAAKNDEADAHFAVGAFKSFVDRSPLSFFGFFIGNHDPYPGFVADNTRLDRELTRAGVRHRFRLYRGGHDAAFWDAHEDAWLSTAVAHLDAPRR